MTNPLRNDAFDQAKLLILPHYIMSIASRNVCLKKIWLTILFSFYSCPLISMRDIHSNIYCWQQVLGKYLDPFFLIAIRASSKPTAGVTTFETFLFCPYCADIECEPKMSEIQHHEFCASCESNVFSMSNQIMSCLYQHAMQVFCSPVFINAIGVVQWWKIFVIFIKIVCQIGLFGEPYGVNDSIIASSITLTLEFVRLQRA